MTLVFEPALVAYAPLLSLAIKTERIFSEEETFDVSEYVPVELSTTGTMTLDAWATASVKSGGAPALLRIEARSEGLKEGESLSCLSLRMRLPEEVKQGDEKQVVTGQFEILFEGASIVGRTAGHSTATVMPFGPQR